MKIPYLKYLFGLILLLILFVSGLYFFQKDFLFNISLLFIFLIIYTYILYRLISTNKTTSCDTQSKKDLAQTFMLEQTKEIVKTLAHQWKQPLSQLNSIAMKMEVEYDMKKLDKTNLDEKLLMIEKITEKMSLKISDLSFCFTTNSSKENFQISEAIEHTINLFKSINYKRNLNIKLELNKEFEIINYRSDFIHVLLSIVTNCVDSFKLYEVKDLNITINTKKVNNKIEISIFDNIKDTPHSNKNDDELSICQYIIEEKMGGVFNLKNSIEGRVFLIKFNLVN